MYYVAENVAMVPYVRFLFFKEPKRTSSLLGITFCKKKHAIIHRQLASHAFLFSLKVERPLI